MEDWWHCRIRQIQKISLRPMSISSAQNLDTAQTITVPYSANCVDLLGNLVKGMKSDEFFLGYLVTLDGLLDIKLLPGETMIMGPAIGKFCGSAVMTALMADATLEIKMLLRRSCRFSATPKGWKLYS